MRWSSRRTRPWQPASLAAVQVGALKLFVARAVQKCARCAHGWEVHVDAGVAAGTNRPPPRAAAERKSKRARKGRAPITVDSTHTLLVRLPHHANNGLHLARKLTLRCACCRTCCTCLASAQGGRTSRCCALNVHLTSCVCCPIRRSCATSSSKSSGCTPATRSCSSGGRGSWF